MPWRLHIKASENEDGTGPDRFFVHEKQFRSFRQAKRLAKRYERAKPAWLRELRIYRES